MEALAAAELNALGIKGEVEAGGVAWNGSVGSAALANLWSRVASRIVLRAGEFRARTFFELERQARKIEWSRFIAPGVPVAFRVTCRKSKLYHSDAVAQRFAEAASRALGEVVVAEADDDDETQEKEGGVRTAPQLFIVRFSHDVCTVSADTSGELLHRRGYRLATAKAPLRETIAAAMLNGAGWDGGTALLDPMCGAGTIAIEGAMIARRIPPGGKRAFAFMRWPEHDDARWREVHDRASAQIKWKAPSPIVAADRDAGAVEAARANAARAGVDGDVELHVRPISASERFADAGLIAVNPPYGARVGGGKQPDLRNLYAQLGAVARERFAGWTMALLSAERRLDAQVGIPLEERLRTSNGGIPVRLMVGESGAVARKELA